MLNPDDQTNVGIKPGRLKKRPEFLYVASQGQKWVSQNIIVQAIENNLPSPRFGFTATKKIGNAVMRNTAKRRLRACVDSITQNNTSLKNYDIVLIARKETGTCDYTDLVKNLTWCLKRLDVIKN